MIFLKWQFWPFFSVFSRNLKVCGNNKAAYKEKNLNRSDITVVIQVLGKKNLIFITWEIYFFSLPKQTSLPTAAVGFLAPKTPLQQKEQLGQLMADISILIDLFVLFLEKKRF